MECASRHNRELALALAVFHGLTMTMRLWLCYDRWSMDDRAFHQCHGGFSDQVGQGVGWSIKSKSPIGCIRSFQSFLFPFSLFLSCQR